MPEDPDQIADQLNDAPAWDDIFRAEHEKLHARFGQLLLAASFASLFFLTQFQPLFPEESRNYDCLLSWSWLLGGLSAFTGAIHYLEPQNRDAERRVRRNEHGEERPKGFIGSLEPLRASCPQAELGMS